MVILSSLAVRVRVSVSEGWRVLTPLPDQYWHWRLTQIPRQRPAEPITWSCSGNQSRYVGPALYWPIRGQYNIILTNQRRYVGPACESGCSDLSQGFASLTPLFVLQQFSADTAVMPRWLQHVKYEMSLDSMQHVRSAVPAAAGCNDQPSHEADMIKIFI